MSGAPSLPATAPLAGLGRSFILLWWGQLLSLSGSTLTSFALAVWVFQRTGSIIDFTGTILFATLPALLVTPWAGSLADRSDKRIVMLLSIALAALCTAAVGLLIWSGRFELWHLYLMLAVLSVSGAAHGPAAHAAITSIVPKAQLGRATGMLALSGAVAQVSAPLMAGVLLAKIGLEGIILIDFLSYGIAFATTYAARIPPAAPVAPGASAGSVWQRMYRDCSAAVLFFRLHPSMAMVYGYLALGTFLSGMVAVLVTPMVLSSYSEQTLAIVMTAGAVGALAGGAAMALWGGPSRWTVAVLGFNVVEGLFVAFAGATTSVVGLCICSFVVMFSGTMLGACVENLWRRKVPLERQGSVFALEQIMNMSALPLSAVVGGLLVHTLFEPALLAGGIWAEPIGSWFGIGKGRGTGFFFVVVGLMVATVSLLAMSNRHLRHLERAVPDAIA